ncbi:unnamed protein product [Amoebophrya sp. A120]|nr:unnamed protein product [Amoebophrya sp. A120]|eukprot:GSA120T00008332001.1
MKLVGKIKRRVALSCVSRTQNRLAETNIGHVLGMFGVVCQGCSRYV